MQRRIFLMTTGKTAAITAVASSLATRLTAAEAAAPGKPHQPLRLQMVLRQDPPG